MVYWKTTKKDVQVFAEKWCGKEPFGYRVAHHGYLLTSCRELLYLSLNSF